MRVASELSSRIRIIIGGLSKEASLCLTFGEQLVGDYAKELTSAWPYQMNWKLDDLVKFKFSGPR